MEKIILALLFCCVCAESVYAQFGFQETKETRLVPAVIMISYYQSPKDVKPNEVNKSSSWTYLVNGFIKQIKMEYFGDRMPGGSYGSYWQNQETLDKDKKPFGKDIIIWQYKEVPSSP